MIYQGNHIRVDYIGHGIAEFEFCASGSVNKFDQSTLQECQQALETLHNEKELQGVMFTSNKKTFIVGADITEFLEIFKKPANELISWIKSASDIFDLLEDLPVPTISAITGYALGGGCELVLATDYRIADQTARIGLPEVKLGLIPGFGGTVRLPRIIGADNAVEWITTGKENKAEQALKVGAVDAVVAPEHLKEAALGMLKQAIAGELDWQTKRQAKLSPLAMNKTERTMSFSTAKAMVFAKAGKHYPSPVAAVSLVEAASTLGRAEAMALENQTFIQLAQSPEATAQIGLFLNDQVIKGIAKKAAKSANKAITQATVLGAGIMGGGIAYQSASRGIPAVMKDINQDALALGLTEASTLLGKQLSRGKINASKMAATLNSIVPSLSYDSVKDSDIVVEAVVENPKIKGIVLKEVEGVVAKDAIITSNTSTISINRLAENLDDPSRFCGMHFFNPVPKMPLVEIIRGEHTSDETIATVVAYASKLGKSPIVVNDCPGFYVNRVLFPYLAGFSQLVTDGADFIAIDKVMTKVFGWPMGPAHLNDVVGIDTAYHCIDVMAEGFPTRMIKRDDDPVGIMFKNDRYGQKNDVGFYRYQLDKKGRKQKVVDETTFSLLYANTERKEFSTDEIIERCMIPMVNEAIRCLEEGIIASAAEGDMGLIYGLGFPPFRGGVFRYVDALGLAEFVKKADQYVHLGEMYQVTEKTRAMAASGATFL